MRGLGMADDVGDGFADCETENSFFSGVQLRQWGFAG
jgi:hypothetical protein